MSGSASMTKPRETEQAFACLVQQVHHCRACARMEGRVRVLGQANGPLDARVLFVAEAPGRLGADRTGVPLSGDQAGRNFDTLLEAAGLDRGAVFITNAVLCNPRDPRGRNAQPSTQEIRNCSAHLLQTIEIIQPPIVIALGRVALEALRRVASHDAVLARDVAAPMPWNGRCLVPLYHPGARACIHRPLNVQMQDYRTLRRVIDQFGPDR